MQPRFVGNLNWAPQNPLTPDLWRLEEYFGQVTSDGRMILCPPWQAVNGASIPRWAWWAIGHPFEKGNKFWSTPHDMGYCGHAIVLDLSRMYQPSPEQILATASVRCLEPYTVPRLKRDWWDRVQLAEAMRLCSEPAIKRFAVYRSVRAGGTKPWRRNHTPLAKEAPCA